MKTKATVLKTEGDKAYVKAVRESACSGCEGCEAKGSCHAEILLSETPKAYELEVKNEIGAKKGDIVEIDSGSNFILVFAVIVFVLPIVAAVAGFFIASIYLDGFYSILVSAAVFMVTFIFGAVVSNKVIVFYSQNIISKIIKERGNIAGETNAYKE